MGSLRIEICNERFLPRFGVDRLLLLLAGRLAGSGHQVSLACLRCDTEIVSTVTTDLTVLPLPPGLDMVATEASVANLMARRWQQSPPDVVVIGGWPFFEAAVRAASFGVKSIFIDAGAVAQNGLAEPLLGIQQELRRVRQLTLPSIDRVLPISDFIRSTQTEPDRGTDTGVRTVLLGSDHMASGIFGRVDQAQQGETLLGRCNAYVRQGMSLLLALGRFEPQGYKNSAAAYGIFRMVREQTPGLRLLLLDAGADCSVPEDLVEFVDLLGVPDDDTLQEVMLRCVAGISTSLWEGFNLPIAEMQWLGRPALAFNLGAHPEVIADPWLLCEDGREMAAKLVKLLHGESPIDLPARFATFRGRRRWEETLTAWEFEICGLAQSRPAIVDAAGDHLRQRRIVLVDITSASLDPANPGVIRVARHLCSELQHQAKLDLVFAAWNSDSGDYIFLDHTRRNFLQGYGGPRDGLGLLWNSTRNMTPGELIAAIGAGRQHAPLLFLPEVILDGQASERANWGRGRGYKIVAILYDLIPINYQELCDPNVSSAFPSYLAAVAESDAIWSISEVTLRDFTRYLAERGQELPRVHEAIWLPGQFGSFARRTGPDQERNGREITILCVSTLEPRKNHLRLLEAFQMLRAQRPDLPLRLVLVGNRYAGAPEIAQQVQAAQEREPCIEWHGAIDDTCLAAEFERATFTVYPSLVEGFGLPILESLWMGRPCLTHKGGVMRELAALGGCVTADMNDSQAIMQAIERLATDPALLAQLGEQAVAREITTWQEYARNLGERLVGL